LIDVISHPHMVLVQSMVEITLPIPSHHTNQWSVRQPGRRTLAFRLLPN
jgi:hypothetical protein